MSSFILPFQTLRNVAWVSVGTLLDDPGYRAANPK